MPEIECPIPGCEYKTPDVDAAIVAALLNTHTTTHTNHGPTVEKVKRPTITSAGTSEDWLYVTATKPATDQKKVVQLLECCDEPLCKDLT